MIEEDCIQELSEQIAYAFRPKRIVLFGSYAYGTPTQDSDVDLFVILPFEGLSSRKAIEILKTVNPHIPVDLVVRTPEEVERRLALNDFFLREIMEKGKVLYESAHS